MLELEHFTKTSKTISFFILTSILTQSPIFQYWHIYSDHNSYWEIILMTTLNFLLVSIIYIYCKEFSSQKIVTRDFPGKIILPTYIF